MWILKCCVAVPAIEYFPTQYSLPPTHILDLFLVFFGPTLQSVPIMATDATEEGETFAQRTAAFVEWFKKRPGTLLSDKVELVDMRRMGAGRGVGERHFLERK